MENFRPPAFKYSLRVRKKLLQHQWFEFDESGMESSTYDDYILLKRQIKEEPILGYIVKIFGGRIAKKEPPLDNRT